MEIYQVEYFRFVKAKGIEHNKRIITKKELIDLLMNEAISVKSAKKIRPRT